MMALVSQRRFHLFLLGAIVLLGTALRLYRVGAIALRADEAMTLFFASDLQTIFRQVTTDDPHLPFYYFFLHFWLMLAGTSELAERFPTVFGSVLVVPLTFLLGRVLYPRWREIALVGAFLASINPYFIWDAQDAYIYAFLTAFSLASFIAFLRALTQPSRAAWIPYVAASLMALVFHYFAFFVLAVQNVLALFFLLSRRINRRAFIAFWIAQVVLGLIYSPWLIFALPVLTTFRTDFLPPVTWPELINRTLIAFSVGRSDNRLMPIMIEAQVGTWLALGFAGLFIWGVAAHAPKESTPKKEMMSDSIARGTLGIYLGLPLVALFFISQVRFPVYDERYVLYLAPAFLVMVARGIAAGLAFSKTRWLAAASLVFVVAASAHSLYNYWYVPAFAKSPDWQGFVQTIVSAFEPGDVLIQNYPDPALPYYLQNRVPRVLLPRTNTPDARELDADLARLSSKYSRIWFQPVASSNWDPDGLVATWLERHARAVRAFDVRGARLELYLSAPSATSQARAVRAVFGDRIELVAFDFEPRHLTLYWQAHAEVERGYTVFVHLVADDGSLIGQQDNPPVKGTFRTTDWKPEEIVVDQYDLPSPDARYALMVGLYDSETLTRLPVTSARVSENRLLLMEVRP